MVFEQPLTERVRTFLRLEFLFAQRRHHPLDHSDFGVRANLHALLDVLALTARSDLKSEVIKDIQEQENFLRKRPQVLVGLDARQTLEGLGNVLKAVQRMPTHFAGATLRAHEFLDALAKRTAIPGGAASFDLPAVHRWLHEPAELIATDCDRWFAHFAAYEAAVAACLHTLRHAGATEGHTAPAGVYLYTPPKDVLHQLLRVQLPQGANLYPEISAGRHRYSLRFMAQGNVDARAQQATGVVSFSLQCCSLTAA